MSVDLQEHQTSHARLMQAAHHGNLDQWAPTAVARSWRRCQRDHRLDPFESSRTKFVRPHNLELRRRAIGDWLQVADVELEHIHAQIAGSGHALAFADNEGILLRCLEDEGGTEDVPPAHLRPGADWSEKSQGTNAIGTCLVEKTTLVVRRHEHYRSSNCHLVSCAAPLFDSSGELVAVLSAIGANCVAQQHTAALLDMAAQHIENRVFNSEFAGQYLLRFHSRAEFVGTLGEGCVAVDRTGTITATNRRAGFMLCPGERTLIGARIDSLFTTSFSDLIHTTPNATPGPVPVHCRLGGQRLWVAVDAPREDGRHAHQPTAAPQTPPRRDVNVDALPECGDTRSRRGGELALRVLARKIPVLLYGETGTGKGYLASQLHRAGPRAERPFVPINCAALPEDLIESELFGYRPGAFTGARREGRRGLIQSADGGTLFLDEIGDMPATLQSRLLRVLEEQEVTPLGASDTKSVDLAVIAATNKDLKRRVDEGTFRADLYYRLAGLSITLPALREREDIDALIDSFLAQQMKELAITGMDVSPSVLDALRLYNWPGNIRQLHHVIRSMLALCDGRCLTAADLPDFILAESPSADEQPDGPNPNQLSGRIDRAQRATIAKVLAQNHWNITRAARQLGISRATLRRRIKRQALSP